MAELYSLGPQLALLPPTAATKATSWLETRPGPAKPLELEMDSGVEQSPSAQVSLPVITLCVRVRHISQAR